MQVKNSRIVQPPEGLIAQCSAGDAEAFAKLVESMQTFVYSVAFKILLNEEDAKDAVQDTFIKVWKNIGSYTPSCLFSTWLYTITVNICLDVLKKRRRKSTQILYEAYEKVTIEDKIESADLVRHIRKLAAKLPEKQKVIFVLKDLEDLSIDEISLILKMSKGLVKSNLYYARKNMCKNLTKH